MSFSISQIINKKLPVEVLSGNVLLSGKDVAFAENRILTPSTPFTRIAIINRGSSVITFAVNESSLVTTKPILIPPYETVELSVSGTTLQYSAPNDTLFHYTLTGGIA